MKLNENDIPLNLDEEALTGSGFFEFKAPDEVSVMDIEQKRKPVDRVCTSQSEIEEQSASFDEWSAAADHLNETSRKE